MKMLKNDRFCSSLNTFIYVSNGDVMIKIPTDENKICRNCEYFVQYDMFSKCILNDFYYVSDTDYCTRFSQRIDIKGVVNL